MLDAMDEEPKGESAILDGLARVLQGPSELLDLVHDATLRGVVARKLGIASRLIQWNIDVLLRGRMPESPSDLIGPCRGIGQGLTWLQQGLDLLHRPVGQMPFGQLGDDAMAEAPHAKAGVVWRMIRNASTGTKRRVK
jgi:hypothetical protein